MRKLITYIVLLLTSVSSFSQSSTPSRSLLEWNEYYTLTWEDFQGQATEGSMGDAGTAVQIKATPYYVKDKVRYNVFAYFDRSKSWSRDQSTLLLAHEQLHFEIAELYARKIRQKIADLEKKGVNDVKTYNAAINAILNESNEVDQRYDVETLHGAMQKKQAQWQKTVKQELQSLKFYKKPKNVISVGKRLSSQPLIFG